MFTNRLEQGIHLQSDATVSYGTGGTSIFTTAAQRADSSNKYNTYANPGLPIGPISAPGSKTDFYVSMLFADRSLATITFSAKGETFEGVREARRTASGPRSA